MQKENRTSWFKNFFLGQWFTLKTSFYKEFIEPKKSELFKSITWIVIGNLLLALGASLFLVPGEIVTGGTSGIAIIIQQFYNMATGNDLNSIIDINHIITISTVFFFILGYFLLGFGFTLKTLISTIIYPLGIYLFDFLREITVINGTKLFAIETYINNPNYDSTSVMILAGIFGGILMGAGVAFSFKGGGSTGGTDCITMWLHKKFGIPTSISSFGVDFIIIFTGLFSSQNLINFLIGILASLLCSFVIERIFSGNSSSYCAEIVSAKYRSISNAINKNMERGTTLYEAEGGYTGFERKVVKVSFTRNEYRELLRLIKAIDPYAFITITNVDEIHGNGFSYDDGDEPLQIKEHHSARSIKKAQLKAMKLERITIKKNDNAVLRDFKKAKKEEKKNKKK